LSAAICSSLSSFYSVFIPVTKATENKEEKKLRKRMLPKKRLKMFFK